ncbi:MAG: energy transducer TonB [Acidobacteriota bacterium]|nr:energy transducer TonB [Acidobacteriota bacterium]
MEEDQKLVAECVRKVRQYQIATFGRELPKVTGDFCFDLCPTSLVKPHYPREAKRLRISGQVKIETIVDERGKVIYARTLEGSPFLSQSAKRAAYLSSFMPKKTCEDKPIKFLATITYNFVLNR